MVLRMTCPTKRKGSDNWYFRRTIPADIQRILAKLPKSRWPRKWYAKHIVISLGTADRAAAKEKYPEVAAAVERQMKALREGPKPLTPKQIAALLGEVYKGFSQGLEDDPILSAEQWRDIAEGIRALGKPNNLLIGGDTPERRGQRLERHLGKMADALLAKHSIVTDERSRLVLIERLATELPKASDKLARNAEGDYSPDSHAHRFPEWKDKAAVALPSQTLSGIAEAWHAAALARDVTERDANRFQRVVNRFAEWLGHDDATKVTRADVARWADARSKQGIAASTINKVDTAGLRAVFEWATERDLLPSNPLAKGVKIVSRGKAKQREQYFTRQEAAAILSAALAVKPSKREAPKTTAAKRGVPWLCAYSGARVVEMIQLRKQDIRKAEGAWIARLTPEAGGIKTNEYRDVPLHPHLIDLGFVNFVDASGEGHLFVNVRKGSSPAGAVDGVYSRIRQFVRAVVPDSNVQPNHAWRYTFKTRGLDAEIEPLVLDVICGHAPGTKGDGYTKATLKKRIAAMRKFPRYSLTAQRKRSAQ